MPLREHLILSRTFDTDSLLEKADDAFDSLEQKQDLLFLYESSEELSGEVTAHVYRDVNTPGTMVSLVDDRAAKLQYLAAQADDPDVLSRVVRHLAGTFPVRTLEEVRSEAGRKLDEDPEGLVRLAVAAAPKFDQATFDLLVRGLQATDASVREAAAVAAGVTEWKEMAPEIRKALAAEKNDDVRRLLQAALPAD